MTLDDLKALEAKATPGPWGSIVFQSEDCELLASVGPSKGAVCRMTTTQPWQVNDGPHNAALIAAMRNTLPAFLAVAEAAQDSMRVLRMADRSKAWQEERDRVVARLEAAAGSLTDTLKG